MLYIARGSFPDTERVFKGEQGEEYEGSERKEKPTNMHSNETASSQLETDCD